MNRSSCIALTVAAGLGIGSVLSVSAAQSASKLQAEANKSIAAASAAVEDARTAINNGKQLLAKIPADSPVIGEVAEMLKAAKENWTLAVSALESAKESASKIGSATSSDIAQDYKLLAAVNAGVALSGANVVQTSLMFVEAVADNKSESLDVIRMAMANSVDAAEQVQINYERVKSFIAEKYSK